MFNKVLIANRGEIACRVIRTLKKMGIQSVAVYSDADAHSRHVAQADEAVHIGPAPAAQSYLNVEKILDACRQTGAQAIHPGYGFLSENPAFADACRDAGIVFIGPTGDQMRAFGLKHTARELALKNNVPMLPGSGLLKDLAHARVEAEKIGYPVMLKATAGGGGIGMRVCRAESELAEHLAAVERLSKANFKESGIYLEKFVAVGRHIEVQIFGDGLGNVIALGERDCSVQRRNQKVIEETPAPHISPAVRQTLFDAATKLAKAVKYQSAGTVEFIYDTATQHAYFLEVNTRLQVEHTVTEEVTGIDLVEWMVKQAAGEFTLPAMTPATNQSPRPPFATARANVQAPSENAPYSPQPHDPEPHASIQVRLYAEDPNKNFQPSAGKLTHVHFPADARIETWVESGSEISPYYDPLIAKIISKGTTRAEAIANLQSALAQTKIYGIESNLAYLQQILADDRFRAGEVSTGLLATFTYKPNTIDVLEGGAQSTVQDYPGRIGYWDIGVPPSGPMDHLSFRLANRLLENPENAAAFEFTLTGPALKFNTNTTIALTGAQMAATLDGAPIDFFAAVPVKTGQTLRLGTISGPGFRTYLAIAGGIDVPAYLNSRATFTLGNFGGHAGRTLRTGDVIALQQTSNLKSQISNLQSEPENRKSTIDNPPLLTHDWQIRVIYGPHGAPDFFTPNDIETIFSTTWKIHYNSNRTGVRLIGPKPQWARADGGEAGLHPSNIHDNAYAIGTIDYTGDMPVILGPDGPSLGGFVCPATIIQADLWKIGQLKPGDSLQFIPVTIEQANQLERDQDNALANLHNPQLPIANYQAQSLDLPTEHADISNSEISNLKSQIPPQIENQKSVPRPAIENHTPILHTLPATPARPSVVYRLDGDKYLLVEYGPLILDLNLRFRVHTLTEHLRTASIPGIIDLTPGIRSLHIHYDSRILPLQQLMDLLLKAEDKLPAIENIEVPTRIVHMPLSWDDVATRKAIDIYMKSVRPDAPWCPWNIEFIRRINGLDSVEQVKDILFSASYLTLGLGDVYLGAPVATPIDPRHRLVTTKYNPARTWTAENSVGIGGAYLCIYGMEGPGGYQFVGRTVQCWNTYKATADFTKPWLLRFFDQIRFYPVSAEQLLKHRENFLQGKFKLNITRETFSLKKYNAFLRDNAPSIAQFKTRQQAAFDAERERWRISGQLTYAPPAEQDAPPAGANAQIPEGCQAVSAGISGNIWKIPATPGAKVKAGQTLVIIEAMKMEINVLAPCDGTIEQIICREDKPVTAGQQLLILRA
jgi:urea carboxylase